MVTVQDIFHVLDTFAPVGLKMDFDNVGLLVGAPEHEVSDVLLALDITDDVITEAAGLGAQLIVSHHPLFFDLKAIDTQTYTGRKIDALCKQGISAICMHTNLDIADGGVCDALAKKVGIQNPEYMGIDGYFEGKPFSLGRLGHLDVEMPFQAYLKLVKSGLNANGLRYWDAGRPVKNVAVIGGSGGSELEKVLSLGCDTFVTADIKYDVFLKAKEAGLNLIDADHFCTENVVIPVLLEVLAKAFPTLDLHISKQHVQTAQFF